MVHTTNLTNSTDMSLWFHNEICFAGFVGAVTYEPPGHDVQAKDPSLFTSPTPHAMPALLEYFP